MRYHVILSLVITLVFGSVAAQLDMLTQLEGRWKMKESDVIETWQVIGKDELKGSSYTLEEGKVKLLENLLLRRKNGKWTYTAQVLNQNAGRPVEFYEVKSKSGLCFKNDKHDFPQQICYEFVSSDRIRVELSGEGREPVVMNLERVVGKLDQGNENENPAYDAGLASRLGADDYGMKMYVLVILKTGDNDSVTAGESQELFRGHLDNIGRLVKEGKMIIAGPLGKNELSYRGIFIMDMSDIDEVRDIMQSDPAISAGLLNVELMPWYGSAALPEYLPASDKIWKKKP